MPTSGSEKAAALRGGVALQPHQERVRERVLADSPRMLVYHGLGTGKTLAALAAAESAGRPYVAAVPASLRPNFRKEREKFTDRKTPAEVMSHTALARGAEPLVAPETVIVDEAHRLRNPLSAQARGVRRLADRAERLLLLTGSPIVNDPGDLATPATLLSGRTWTPEAFRQQFVGTRTVRPPFLARLRGVRPGVEPALKHERALRRLFDGRVDYQPPRAPEGVRTRETAVPVEMSDEQEAVTKLLWGQLGPLTRWKLRHDFPLSAAEAKRLQSFMTGPREAGLSTLPFAAEADPLRAFRASSKLREAERHLASHLRDPAGKALVFSNFVRAGLDPYAAGLDEAGIPYRRFHGGMSDADRAAAVDAYNRGEARVLLLGPAGGEGISTRGTRLIQVLDPHFHETRTGQAIGRGLRFDSHADLPPDQRDVTIERYESRRQRPSWWRRLFGAEAEPSADQVLGRLAARKDRLNAQFLDVLRDLGSAKEAGMGGPPLDFGMYKLAEDAELDPSGLALPSIPADVFNRAVWQDVTRAPNPWQPQAPGTLDLRGAYVVSRALEQAQAQSGSRYVSPLQVAVAAGETAGKGWLAGLALGKTLGFLAGLDPHTQGQLQQAGLWGGMLAGAVGALTGGR